MLLRLKLKAAALHCLVTILIAAITASIVYFVWYQGAFAKMLNGTELYLIVLAVEICLGPLMSLVIYNPAKSHRELIQDYSIVVFVQMVALCYGLYSVAISRPVYLVFVKDRIEIVSAVELKSYDLIHSNNPGFTHLPWFFPKNICTNNPTDPYEKSDLLQSALAGKDIQLMPKYYRECGKTEVLDKAFTKSQLFSMTPIKLTDLPIEIQSQEFKWLPVVTRFNSWIVLYRRDSTGEPLYLNLNPFQF